MIRIMENGVFDNGVFAKMVSLLRKIMMDHDVLMLFWLFYRHVTTASL